MPEDNVALLITEIAKEANKLYNTFLDRDMFEHLYGHSIDSEEYDEMMALLLRMSKAKPK